LLGEVQARNPHLQREDLERAFADYLGIKKVLWLNRGIVGDDTHGHIDDLARFVGVRTVVAVEETNPHDENYEPLQENLERLAGMTDLDGRSLELITIPLPGPLFLDGQRLPASYANFYIANSVVLVPTFNDPNDRVALGTLADLFPGRKVVGIHAVDLVWGLGTIHCLTQQEPAAITPNESPD
jgi:agmatine deiminase